MVAPLHIAVRKKGLSNTDVAATTEEKKINNRYRVTMSREYYFWCLVDRYLSTGNINYSEALEYARRDIYEIPKNGESLSLLAGRYILENRSSPGTFKQTHNRQHPYRSWESSQK
jgi:hypothetical protein